MESGTKRQLIRQLIGKEGKGLRKILEEHDVNVHFAKENDDDTEDLEVGAVHIHGNKVGVAKVKKIFIDMMNEKVLNSFEKMFMVPQQALSQIVGRGGSNMVRIGQKHNVKIDFGVENDGLVECILRGPEEGCEAAQEMIMEIVKNVQDTIDLVVQIPIQLHRMIIGPSGSHIKEFINHFGMDNVRANFPKGGLSSKENYNAVTFTANESLHEEIKTKLEESIASLLKSTKFPGIITPDVANTKAEVTIPKEDVNFVCGKSFETLVDLMKKYGVSIWLKSLANTVSVIICGTAALQKEVNSVKSDLMVLLFNLVQNQTLKVDPTSC
jgi:predicted PilT family ATPase